MLNHAKYEIEAKLEKEEANLEMLRERMERSNQMTKNMVEILDSFESRLSKLEDTILPIYDKTEKLQRQQQNIDKTLIALDTVISYYRVSEEVEHIIRAKPQRGPDGQIILGPFFRALQKLETAQEYFQKNSKDSMELENVTMLFNQGGDTLSTEFRELLHKHSAPVKPVVILDMVNADDESSTQEMPPAVHQFPPKVSETLIQIAEWLIDHSRDEYMNVYAAIRASILLSSIKQLRDHQKSASGGSAHNVQAISSPLVKQKFPGQKASKRLQQVFEKKANKMLLRASQTLEQSTGFTLGNRRLTAYEYREDVVEETEMANYLLTVMALQKLLESERVLMAGIIPLNHHLKIFEKIIREAMDLVVQDAENIAARAKKCIARHDFAAVLVVFPILKHLHTLRPDFERTMEGCDESVRSKFKSILRTLQTTGEKALDDFIENVKNDSASQLPRDGTVHELTSNVLVFLEQVTEYTDTIATVLVRKPGAKTDPKALIGNYIRRVLAQLGSTLVSKSEMYPDQCLKYIFMLNNYHYILKSLQRSGLLELVLLDDPDCEIIYQKRIKTTKEQYIQCWSKVLSYIYSSEDSGPLQPGKLRDKDRAALKEKFAGFNKEIEEISRTQRGYSVPDLELNQSLKRDNKELILPKYNAFYEKYSTVDFSKNKEKYVKYSPTEVSSLIDRLFFDQSI